MIFLWVLLSLYLAILFGVAWVSLHPFRSPVFISPEAMGAVQEEVQFSVEGLTIRGWWVEAPGSETVAVLSHGYMMNRAELTPLAVELWREGVSCLLIDQRGHGRSSGRKTGLGWRERAEVLAGVHFAQQRCPGAKVLLVGSSMGAAASAFAAAEEPASVDALILDSAYSQLPSAILGWWRFLGGKWLEFLFKPIVLFAAPLAGLNPWKIDVADALQKLDIPVLILHGNCDALALPAEAERNFEACKNAQAIVWLDQCGHSEGRWIHANLYSQTVRDFLRDNGLISWSDTKKPSPNGEGLKSKSVSSFE